MGKTRATKQHPSPIRWAGGKLSHIGHIQPLWEAWNQDGSKRFVELFSGSLALSFSLSCDRVLANDSNFGLINFYQEMISDPKLSMVEMLNDSEYFYERRTEFNQLTRELSEIEGGIFSPTYPRTKKRMYAELFYYLNRFAFNGLYRVNSKNEFNVSYCKNPDYYGLNDLTPFFSGCDNWEFISADFSAIELDNDTDFIFADPPYDTEFTSYTKDGFTFDDQIRLCEYLKDFTGPTILCNQRTERIIDLYTDYDYEIKETKRPKNFRGKKTLESKREIMAIKNMRIP